MDADLARILVISPDGMLGRAWVALLSERGIDHEAVSFPAFDLTRSSSIDELDVSRFGWVVNCSGWTDVDGAEQSEAAATAVNGDGVGALARACASSGTSLLHYSTDYVFSGQALNPYGVDEPLAPLNAYGRSKAVGEEQIRACGGAHLIVRTSWLYAPWAKNFVLTMVRLGSERESIQVVDDQRGRPTSSEHLAATSLALMQNGATGTFHVTDGGECTWYEFARTIVERVNPRCVVRPCTTADFPRPAKRPAYSVLDLERTEALVGPMPPWQDNLTRVLDRVLRGG